jgi:maltodextrin utilization protein YvdJ
MQVVLNQKKSVTDLLKMLTAVEQTDPVSGMVADLQELEKAYAALNIEEQIHKNRADLVLTDKNLEQISIVVAKMRKSIVE